MRPTALLAIGAFVAASCRGRKAPELGTNSHTGLEAMKGNSDTDSFRQ